MNADIMVGTILVDATDCFVLKFANYQQLSLLKKKEY